MAKHGKHPEFGVKEIAMWLNARRNDSHSTVLLLGSRAGAFFRSEQFYEILQQYSVHNFMHLTHLKRFKECYTTLTVLEDRYGEVDIYHMLYTFTNKSVPTRADDCLVECIKQGYFEEIITTNIDDSLEQTLIKAGMREGYDFGVYDSDKMELNDERTPLYKIIKVFGDIKTRGHVIKNRFTYLEQKQEFKKFLERTLKKDTLVIGYDTTWDQDILQAIPSEGQTLWFVNEENPSEDALLSNFIKTRQDIAYMEGGYDRFVTKLHQCLTGPPALMIDSSILEQLQQLQKGQTASNNNKPIVRKKRMIKQVFTHGYALLIGVGADLPVTVDDATAVRDLLINPARAGYPSDQVTLLTETRANRDGILAAFEHLIQQVKNDPEATVIVYFSGHGGKFRFQGQEPEYFLVPYGYDPVRDQETALSDQEFTSNIEAIHARKLIVLLDCCHAGGVPLLKNAATTFEKSPVPPGLLDALQAGSGRVVIASSRENEYSYTGTPYSVFTACLLEALSGKASASKDGLARILDVVSYLFEHVPQRTSDKQHTFVKKMLDLDDNFPLCYYAGGNKNVPNAARSQPLPTTKPATLTAGQRQRLETKRQQLQTHWDVLNKKIETVGQREAIEHNVSLKFQYQQELAQDQATVKRIENELDEIEQKLSQQ